MRGEERDEARLWRSHILVGFVIMAGEGVASMAYLLQASPTHRRLSLAITAATIVVSGIGCRLAAWVSSRPWRAPFSFAWTLGAIAVVGLCASLDSGIDSPLLFLVVLPVMYAAMLLRPLAVSLCGALSLVMLAAVWWTDPHVVASQQLWMSGAVIVGVIVLAVAASAYQSRGDSARAVLVARLAEAAATDLLTGCMNQQTFHGRLADEVERAYRYRHPLSLLVCDVDLFKDYNDTFGHDRGDAVLAAIGATLRSAVRSGDAVGRIGGDEFGVVLPETTDDDALAFAVRLTERFTDPTLSIGVAALDSAHPTALDLFHEADAAMYAAKASGRKRAVSRTQEPPPTSVEMTPDGRRMSKSLRGERRRRAEAEGALQTFLDESPVGFAFVGADLRLLRANRTILPPGTQAMGVAAPDVWPAFEPYIRQVLHDGLAVRELELSESPDAAKLASFYPVRRCGRVEGVGIVVVDISDRKRLEHSQETLTDAVVNVLAATSEARDPYTAGHQRRVAQIATTAAEVLGFDEWTTRGIELAASIHDIGKLAIPAEILSRPGRLTEAEFRLVQQHAQAGADMLAGVEFPWPVAEMILQHHERLDGSGYPRQLRGDEVGIGARVIAVADVIEAMAAHRPYRPALGIDAGLKVIRDGRGSLFDPQVVDACQTLFHDGRLTYDDESHLLVT